MDNAFVPEVHNSAVPERLKPATLGIGRHE